MLRLVRALIGRLLILFFALVRFLALRKYFKRSGEFIWYPVFNSFADMIDQIYRLTWYLPKREGVIIKIYYRGFEFSEASLLDESHRPWYMHSLPINLRNIRFVKTRNSWIPKIYALIKATLDSQIILWEEPQEMSDFFRIIVLTGKVTVVDHKNRSYASDIHYVNLIHKCMEPGELDGIYDLSKSIFTEKVLDFRKAYKKVYVFGRGPSLGTAFNFDFSDGVRIVCNQTVHGKKVMRHINPQFFAASDHGWHYGCSKMADCFRKDLINYIMENKVILLLPLDIYPLMLYHYPEVKGKMIGIPYSGNKFNFNLIDNFFIKPSMSGLLDFSFPIACTIASDIKMLGVDGAAKPDAVPPQDKIPYPHYRAAVYPEDVVASLHASRPGYYDEDFSNFRRLPVNYYQSYDSEFESRVNEAEAAGFRIETLAPSHLEALKDKFGRNP